MDMVVGDESSHNVSMRRIGIDSYDKLIELWCKSKLPYRPEGRDSREEIRKQIEDDHCNIIGAFDGEKMIGSIIVSWNGRKGWINRLSVVPEYRRMGIARRLVEFGEEWLRGKGAMIICCQIEDWNRGSIAFFKKVGYKLHEDIYYLSKRDNERV